MRVLFGMFLLLLPVAAAAQAPDLPAPPRADVAGTVAWLHVPAETVSTDFLRGPYWTHHLLGSVIGGVYWTEHWKTEISFGRSNHARAWDSEMVQRGSDVTYRSINHRVQYTEVALSQVYQFRRNEWVHPALGAGVMLRRRSGESEYSPAIIHRAPLGAPVVLVPGERRVLDDTRAAAFVTAGVKAYVTPRAFFRSDFQIAFRQGIESVTAHAGFGIDF
jgi:hypothetical protein